MSKQVKTFSVGDNSINDFLKENEGKSTAMSINAFPQVIVVIYDDNKRKTDQIFALEEQIRSCLSQKNTHLIDIATGEEMKKTIQVMLDDKERQNAEENEGIKMNLDAEGKIITPEPTPLQKQIVDLKAELERIADTIMNANSTIANMELQISAIEELISEIMSQ